ncbi:hypothetical protein Glove_302g4 [Diversispora epigaea]|uniref:Uncharacterized protein n=1 Tax=Diversispora epigaea TaxID=1348612 RepID=A0A397HYX6_9GLOM|nr:hypothetical protein Glove_302g4 [Diversispora epigaea]
MFYSSLLFLLHNEVWKGTAILRLRDLSRHVLTGQEDYMHEFLNDVITQVTTNVFKVNIFPSEKNLKKETESIISKSFPDIYKSINSRHHLSLFKKIKTKLLKKLREMRGGIVSRIKSVIFEIFGESQLPRIDFQFSLAEINSWKSDQRVKDAYCKLFEWKLQKKLSLKPGDGELKAEETTEEESEK